MFNKSAPILLSCAIAGAGAFALNAPQVFAEFTSTQTVSDNSVAAGTVKVQIVDGSGIVQTSPLITVANAQPSMTTRTSTINLKNNGSLPAQVTLHSGSLLDSTANSLNNVLVATLKAADGTVLYSGTVSGLTHTFANMAAGAAMTLTVELTWPDLPAVDDNPYQDAGLTFNVVADAVQNIV